MIENLDGVAPHFLLGYLWATMKDKSVITRKEWNAAVVAARAEAERQEAQQ